SAGAGRRRRARDRSPPGARGAPDARAARCARGSARRCKALFARRQYSIRCRFSMWARALAAVAAAFAYLAMAPRVVNGDGLGYLKAATSGTLYPGHVAYVPLLAALARVTGATRPVELLWPARALSAVAAALAALALGSIARTRWASTPAAW